MFRKVVKGLIPHKVFEKVEPTGHRIEAMIFDAKNGFPARGLNVIGVTGTNGKTTTTFMIHRMLHEAGYKVGMMSTVAYGAGMDIHEQMTHMTTSSAPVLFARIKEMRAQGIEWLVLETTSHALAQHRVWGVPYSIAVMTNITHEHLSYHRTFERYRDAKRLMFKLANRNAGGRRIGVVNADDPSAPLFVSDVAHPVTYGLKRGDFRAKNVKLDPNGVAYDVTISGAKYHITCSLPGSFNVYNSLAAVCVGHELGLSPEQIEKGIAALKSVEGRMARIDEGQSFTAIVDYAHSPDSFEKLFKDIKPVVKGRLVVVFGSQGGTGDKDKRPIQGNLAGTYADMVVVTEEDDRGEDGTKILNEIAEGVERAGKVRDKDLFLVLNRSEAMRFAINQAKAGDTLLFLGKGHEKTIERQAGKEEPWDEPGEVRAAIKARLSKTSK